MPATADRLRIALDPALAHWAPEVKYALRCLLRCAGFGYEFVWSSQVAEGEAVDIYYGNAEDTQALVRIPAFKTGYASWSTIEPSALAEQERLPFLQFEAAALPPMQRSDSRVDFRNDIVFSSFWLLIGAAEQRFPRDRWDNLHIEASFIVTSGLLGRPAVSLYAAWLRNYFEAMGRVAVKPAWTRGETSAAFCFTHDVDYPQIIRWIETVRLVRSRGVRALPSIAGIWRGTNHFWKFAEWVSFERAYGARPAFYFMARQGSLWQYARGTPDAFYDVRTPAFQRLFPKLREAGCEVGLHASYHAHRSATQLQEERKLLEQAAGVEVQGGRHHYWHLDPADPHQTLLKHEQIGMQYDASLGFEFFPGFRRGCCHPFHVYHTGLRRELSVVQLPTAWMDDHFDRRKAVNHVDDPAAVARALLDVARAVGGVVLVDYHARGMNDDFYPAYGRWLRTFAERNFDRTLRHCTPAELNQDYRDYIGSLEAGSVDQTEPMQRLAPAAAGSV